MSELPKGWAKPQLNKILSQIVGGGTPSKANSAFFKGTIPFMTVKDLYGRFPSDTIDHISEEAIASSATTFVPADTLIVATRMSLGKIARPTVGVAINQDLKALFLAEGVDKTYVEHFWRSQTNHIQDLGTGTTVKGIRLEDIRELEIPLAPLPEQKRIADKLDSVLGRVEACRDRLDHIPALLKRCRLSILAAATSGRLTEDWRATRSPGEAQRYPGTTAPGSGADISLACLKKTQQAKQAWLQKNSAHNEAGRVKKRLESFSAAKATGDGLPSGWCWAALEDAALMVVDCHNKTAPYDPEGIALVRTTNVRDGRFVWEDLRFVSNDTYLFWSKRCIPEPGDIVFTREAPMGEAAIIPAGKQICLGQRTMLIRPIKQVTSEHYLLIALMDPMFRQRAEQIAVGTGVKHLRVGDVSELQLPLPPTEEQHEIIRRVETLFAFADRLEARLATARKQAEQLTPALLAKAFRGELVPQDPNDEPATELLKRLATTRSEAPKAKRGRKAAA
jgi:type I restriction enzyme S subunit